MCYQYNKDEIELLRQINIKPDFCPFALEEDEEDTKCCRDKCEHPAKVYCSVKKLLLEDVLEIFKRNEICFQLSGGNKSSIEKEVVLFVYNNLLWERIDAETPLEASLKAILKIAERLNKKPNKL